MSEIQLTDEQRQALQRARGNPVEPATSSSGVRVRLCDLATPSEVSDDADQWCKKYGWGGNRRRREVEEQLKLQYYFGGQAVYLLDTADGPIVIAIAEHEQNTPDLRYVLLTDEERPHACLTVPPRWHDTVGEILR